MKNNQCVQTAGCPTESISSNEANCKSKIKSWCLENNQCIEKEGAGCLYTEEADCRAQIKNWCLENDQCVYKSGCTGQSFVDIRNCNAQKKIWCFENNNCEHKASCPNESVTPGESECKSYIGKKYLCSSSTISCFEAGGGLNFNDCRKKCKR